MDPVSVGVAVAVLAGKKLVEKVGGEAGEAGWGLASRLVGRAREWLGDNDDGAAEELAALESDPTPERELVVAERVDAMVNPASRVGRELAEMVEAAVADEVLGPVLAEGSARFELRIDVRSGDVVLGEGAVVEGSVVTNPNVGGDLSLGDGTR